MSRRAWALEVPCPKCGAPSGVHCTSSRTGLLVDFHAPRRADGEELRDALRPRS